MSDRVFKSGIIGKQMSGSTVRATSLASVHVGLVLLLCLVLLCGTTACSNAHADAASAIRQGDVAGAEALYRGLLSKDEADLEALEGLAVALVLQQKWDEALLVQEHLVAADSTNAQIRVELGFNYLNHQDRADDAVLVFKEASILDPTAKNMTFLAQAQKAVGRVVEAERTLQQAIETDSTYGRAYSMLIGLLEDEGRRAEADMVRAEAEKNGLTNLAQDNHE